MKDRHVLVTGGSGGLGTAVTALMLAKGAQVTVPVVDDRQVAHLRHDLGADADRVATPRADLRDEAEVQRVIDAMPRVDAALCLVGGFAMGPTDAFAVEDLRAQLELNVVTTFLVIKHALRRMKETGYGRIVTVGSRAAVEPPGGLAAYAAAKAAVVALTKSVAEETRQLDITANCVLPSVIDTPANRAAMGDADASQWVTPRRLAESIAFLASEAAGELRGGTLPVYGRV
ncbi:3-oxoacyl-ACP reductase FabG [Paraliomyxa miuraensis]|uniref:3-oxoacyl-ACP reductase FabG n=1 Tax=Paraliomyxa miuraensis TaxID=376150 RepID=UPI00225150F2|nr:3-oxoacyl-ACP reductase FabG [Paraliomyxa miuraensis]MCX4245671.1 3-oxoacyl-ACP reductase FabG [Paraliomyxa miuraensis]